MTSGRNGGTKPNRYMQRLRILVLVLGAAALLVASWIAGARFDDGKAVPPDLSAWPGFMT